ncbi:MAG: hypothetical protein Ct9H90mP14_3120 [Methanobacteriota archaeon]|nr:MAG: hypothetical protein Ct9H90mP14_3120 [Euryarchaeota archaeon]
MAALADCGIEGYRDERMMGVWLEGYKFFPLDWHSSIGKAAGLAQNYNTT